MDGSGASVVRKEKGAWLRDWDRSARRQLRQIVRGMVLGGRSAIVGRDCDRLRGSEALKTGKVDRELMRNFSKLY